MKLRQDMLDSKSPGDLEVYQLTTDAERPAGHVYMEAQTFTPDSQKVILRAPPRSLSYEYLLCDVGGGGELIPVVEEAGANGVAMSPDGMFIYYFVIEDKGARLHLRRVSIDGGAPVTITTIEGPPKGMPAAVTAMVFISTISSDGERLMLTVGLGPDHAAYIVFHVKTGDYDVIFRGSRAEWVGSHAQYSRSLDPVASHDIMVQHAHGPVDYPPKGHSLTSADIHVIRDDGSNFRSLPWGRTEDEYAQGHQCWRGQTDWAITSTIKVAPTEENPDAVRCELIESQPSAQGEHIGKAHPDAIRNDLTRELDNPQFYHFGVDREGTSIISDYFYPDGSPFHPEGKTFLYWARLNRIGRDAASDFTYLLDTRTTFSNPETHAHPFLSPDGRLGFFNSDESGVLQAYMIRNLPV